MEIKVNAQAEQWFHEQVGLPEGQSPSIRFKSKLYGSSPLHEMLALIFEVTDPVDPVAQFTGENGWVFFVEKEDAWFFEGHNLIVEYDEELDEPIYAYEKDGEIKQ